jgi:acetyl-CoA carboxylase beta subunit
MFHSTNTIPIKQNPRRRSIGESGLPESTWEHVTTASPIDPQTHESYGSPLQKAEHTSGWIVQTPVVEAVVVGWAVVATPVDAVVAAVVAPRVVAGAVVALVAGAVVAVVAGAVVVGTPVVAVVNTGCDVVCTTTTPAGQSGPTWAHEPPLGR